MVGHKDISRVSRLEVVELGRRRRWSDDEKIRIVEESYAGPRRISATARRHGISRALLKTWRRAYDDGELGASRLPSFAPVTVQQNVPVPQSIAKIGGVESGRVEIVLRNGRRILVGAGIDLPALVLLVEALDGR
jgi:transposase